MLIDREEHAYADQLLTAARNAGHLADPSLERLRVIVEYGVHPEQILLGTGHLSVDAYERLLTTVSGFPCVHIEAFPDAFEIDREVRSGVGLDDSLIVLRKDGRALLVALARPFDRRATQAIHDRLTDAGFTTLFAVMFERDWKAVDRMRHPSTGHGSVRSAWHALHLDATRRDTHVVHVHPFDASDSQVPLRPEMCSACAYTIDYHPARMGWRVESEKTLHGSAMRMVRVEPFDHVPHPWDWLWAVRSFFEKPVGLCVIEYADDPYIDERTRSWDRHGVDAWRERSRLHVYRTHDDEGRELALHAALSGSSVCAIDDTGSVSDWWAPAVDAGVPVRQIHMTKTHHGPVWSSMDVCSYV